MAANDYYSRSQYSNPYHDHDYTNSPLPPLPPTHSPYNDNAYPYSNPQYASSSTVKLGPHDHNDPFRDENSIPLSPRRAKHESAATLDPILPHEQEDAFVRDADPRKSKRRRKSKQGWFRGKITWVVFVLSVVQIGVFIGEIVKNGG